MAKFVMQSIKASGESSAGEPMMAKNVPSRIRYRAALWAILVVLTGLAETIAQDAVVFKDRTIDLKLQIPNGAACWADLNNDGWTDLAFAGSVWRNDAGKSFTKVADVGGTIAADFDNDGLIDLFSWSQLGLFRNAGDMKFESVSLPELPKTVSRGACWGDFDSDGFVDLWIGGYEDWNAGITWPYVVLLNNAGKSFTVAKSGSVYRTRGVTACDFDQDGDVDVYLSNYRLQPNQLFVSDGKSGFNDEAAGRGVVATSPGFGGGHSIGAAWGDFDNDGLMDLFAGNFAHQDGRGDQPKSRFLKNAGPDNGFKFEDRGPCGVHYQESYATPAVGDYDNDGILDVFVTTVYGVASFGRPNHPVLFRGNGQFAVTNANASAQLPNLPPTYQAAWADYDNDGDLDLLSAGKLFENQGTNNSWLKIKLTGDGKTVNRAAVGAQVRITIENKTYTRQVEAGTGEGNQNDLNLHFGLGSHTDPVTLQILWPNGAKQQVEKVLVKTHTSVTYKGD